MPLTAGTRLGPYEVIGAIGAGGMGEVYRARDTKLGRDVAIKVLPESFASDPDRFARFEREAQVLASLNHPNIATIHGFEQSPSAGSGQAIHALVMELVEGPTLADRIAEGAMAIDDALPIARQIVEALDTAHSQGIVHRDLKPANIKVRPDGTVKVLDFGLAKAIGVGRGFSPGGTAGPEGPADRDSANSPTITSPATEMGVILGTAAYMAPEQARGRAVDKRADIWAFGCVLYEMVTGKSLFAGEDLTETLAAVVKENPSLEHAPPGLQNLLRKCLEKDPKKRLRDIGDAWELLGVGPGSGQRQTSARRSALPWAVAGLAVLVAGAALAYIYIGGPAAPAPSASRFQVPWPIAPGGKPIGGAHFFQISPNGRYLTIVSENALWVRALDAIDSVRLERTEGATYPFWSPDSEQIGFFQGGQLKAISRGGGLPRIICDAPDARGGAWGAAGTIVFSDTFGDRGLFQVSEQGGTPKNATTTAATGLSDNSHRYPQFLPDGRRFLYMQIASKPDLAGIYVSAIDGMTPVRVLEGADHAMFAGSRNGGGQLLFRRGETLMAQAFDADRLTMAGNPVAVATSVGGGENTGLGAFTAAEGVLAYAEGVNVEFDLAWINRAGVLVETITSRVMLDTFAMSADLKRVAMGQSVAGRSDETDIWVQSVGASSSRFTFGPRPGWIFPLWSPKGDEIAYATSDLAGQPHYDLRKKRADMAGVEQQLFKSTASLFLWDWSPDGKHLVYSSNGDLFMLPVTGQSKPIQFTKTPEDDQYGQVSPNGRWMVYAAGPRGAAQVHVQPIPPTGALWQISRGSSGSMPRWRSDGKELYYRAADGMLMVVAVNEASTSGAFSFNPTHQSLFHVPAQGNVDRYTYQPGPDGSRFLVSLPSAGMSQPITVVVNWQARVD